MAGGSVSAWQRRLVPVMVGMVVAAAIFFALISVREFDRLQETLKPPASEVQRILGDIDKIKGENFDQQLILADRKIGFVLEQQSIDRRYQQAHAIILGRLWTRFMAFTTGTLMALIGAAFILGKMRESGSEIGAEGTGIRVSVTSASPGIILAVLGTTLIVAALFSYFEVSTTDPPSYRNAAPTEIGDDVIGAAPGTTEGTTEPVAPAPPVEPGPDSELATPSSPNAGG